MKTLLITITLAILLSSLNVQAVQMNYQGVIKQSNTAYQGQGYFKFTLGDLSSSTNYWANDDTAAGEPGTNVTANVTNGFFHLALGDAMTDIPAEVFSEYDDVYLRVWFAEQNTGAYSSLGSEQKILPVPFAVNAGSLEGLTFNSLTNAININDADADPNNEI